MTVQEGISIIRSIINKTSDDNTYTDELLYELLSKARAELLYKDYEKFQFKSDFDKQNICVPMCVATSHDCSCVPIGCKVLKSKFKIPRSVAGRYRDSLEVYSLGEKRFLPGTKEIAESYQYSEFRKDSIFWEIREGYLILWNADTINARPRVIRVNMVAEDPLELASIPKCDEDGNYTGETCVDAYLVDIPMKASYELMAYQRVLDFLNIKERFPHDDTNNGNPTQ